jgi:hypothetical protein
MSSNVFECLRDATSLCLLRGSWRPVLSDVSSRHNLTCLERHWHVSVSANLEALEVISLRRHFQLRCDRQLEALWVLSKPSSGMTDLLGHAVGQTWFNLAILAHIGVWQAAGGTLGASRAQFRHGWPAGACCGPNMIQFGHFGTCWCVAGSWRDSGCFLSPVQALLIYFTLYITWNCFICWFLLFDCFLFIGLKSLLEWLIWWTLMLMCYICWWCEFMCFSPSYLPMQMCLELIGSMSTVYWMLTNQAGIFSAMLLYIVHQKILSICAM